MSNSQTEKELKMYKYWTEELLSSIEDIAKEKYSDVPYWIDTGSRLNVALVMLNQFKKDIRR